MTSKGFATLRPLLGLLIFVSTLAVQAAPLKLDQAARRLHGDNRPPRQRPRRRGALQQQRGALEVELAQKTMAVQNLRERIQQKYQINLDDVRSECITITHADEGQPQVQTLTPEEMAGMPIERLYPGNVRAELPAGPEHGNSAEHEVLESVHITRDGKKFPVLIDRSSFHDEKGDARTVVGGGRYDRLVTTLGASAEIPAIGAAIWCDRLLASQGGK